MSIFFNFIYLIKVCVHKTHTKNNKSAKYSTHVNIHDVRSITCVSHFIAHQSIYRLKTCCILFNCINGAGKNGVAEKTLHHCVSPDFCQILISKNVQKRMHVSPRLVQGSQNLDPACALAGLCDKPVGQPRKGVSRRSEGR